MDDETRSLAGNRRFRELMDEGRLSGPGLELEESNRRAGITDAEWAAADAEIDRLLAEQAAAERTAVEATNGTGAAPNQGRARAAPAGHGAGTARRHGPSH
jgi:hypothetical protein